MLKSLKVMKVFSEMKVCNFRNVITSEMKITKLILQRNVKCMIDEIILENAEAEKGTKKN